MTHWIFLSTKSSGSSLDLDNTSIPLESLSHNSRTTGSNPVQTPIKISQGSSPRGADSIHGRRGDWGTQNAVYASNTVQGMFNRKDPSERQKTIGEGYETSKVGSKCKWKVGIVLALASAPHINTRARAIYAGRSGRIKPESRSIRPPDPGEL